MDNKTPKSNARLIAAEDAFECWRALQPFRGATDREHAAFLAGFRAATNPIKTVAQLEEMLVSGLKRISNEENSSPNGQR